MHKQKTIVTFVSIVFLSLSSRTELLLAASDSREDELRACIAKELLDTVKRNSKSFTQFVELTCPNPKTVPPCKSEKSERRRYDIPAAETNSFNVDSSSLQFVETSSNDGQHDYLAATPDLKGATVELHCKQTQCFGGDAWEKGNIVGNLIYITNVDDTRRAAGLCLHK
jgi:hypothetical protein